MEDEHYNCFDDYYCPEYAVEDMMKIILDALKDGKLSDADTERMNDGVERLTQSECHENYCYLSCLDMWE